MNIIKLKQHAKRYGTKQINYLAVKTVVKLWVVDSLDNNKTAVCFLAGIVAVTGEISKSDLSFFFTGKLTVTHNLS